MKEGFIYVNNNVFSTLLAISEYEQSKGLMYQEWPPPIMTFVYGRPKINKFWMQNTPSPLDIVFCYDNKVSEICYGEPYSTRVIGGNNFSNLVIEFPYGTIDSSNIKIGQSVGIITPSMDELDNIISKENSNYFKF